MDAGARGADSLRLHDPMRQKLVHAQRGGQHPAPDDGDAGELEHSLYGSILAVGAVQDGEHGVNGQVLQAAFRAQKQGGRTGRKQHRSARRGNHPCIALNGLKGAVIAVPVSPPGDADGYDGIFLPVDLLQYGRGRLQ